jgi:N-carbamoylputrescine amidase
MKRIVAAVQMPSEVGDLDGNLERADAHLHAARDSGVDLAVLPEMFNTGYGFLDDFATHAENLDGPSIRFLRDRAVRWNMGIAGGFVERDGRHLYDSLVLVDPDGPMYVYRKRHLVFWERFRFRPGRAPVIADTRWGRIGLAICADMIYRRVWDDYRDRIDLAVVSSAWPDFACARRGRSHWLFGQLGPMCQEIPSKVAKDLGVPVVFSNQCGPTRTSIPLLGSWVVEKLADRFAGQSSVVDGMHGPGTRAGCEETVVVAPITIHGRKGKGSCLTTYPSAGEVTSCGSVHS